MRLIRPTTGALVFTIALVASLTSTALAGTYRQPVAPHDGADAAGMLSHFEAMIAAQVELAGTADGINPHLAGAEREVINGDIVHYRFRVRTGPGKYDFIRLHRVVRERRMFHPDCGAKNVFLQHGDAKDFTGMYLPGLLSPATPDDFGFAVYLAQHGVDVWGIDQGWTLVPEDETDLTFMADWGLARAVRDLGLGIRIARFVRAVTGHGMSKMILSGYSSGVFSTVALLDRETTLPHGLRQVAGYIPIDAPFKTDDPALRDVLLADLEFQRAAYKAGEYGSPIPFKLIGSLARTAPDDPSPLAPGLTNRQLALFFSAAPGGAGFPPPFHYWAGILDDTGFPTGLRLTDEGAWLDFLESAIAWQPTRWFLEYDELLTGVVDVPFDDHLGDIRVPVLNVTAGGSFGDLTLYGISMLGSTDIQTLIPSLGPPAETDIGHIDMFTWPGSVELMWAPVLAWIEAHTSPHGHSSAADLTYPEASTAEPAGSAMTFGIEGIVPNPAHGAFTVSFALSTVAPVRLEIIDVSGRRVHAEEVGNLGAGTHHLQLNDGALLAPGVYVLKLGNGDRVESRRIAIVR